MKSFLLARLLAPLLLGACADTEPTLDYGHPNAWPEPPVLPELGAGRIVVTNSMDDTVSLLPLDGMDTPDWGELARVPVGLNPVEMEGPHHAAFSPAGDFYYVGLSYSVPGAGSGPHGAHGTGTADGYCLKLDARTNRLVASTRVDRNPGDLVISRDGRTLYQTHFDLLRVQEVARTGGTRAQMNATLVLIDTDTMKVKKKVSVCPAPHAVRLSPDETRAYVACLSDEIAVVRLDDPAYPVTLVPLPQAGTPVSPRHSPYALTASHTDGRVWVSTLNGSTVYALDPATGGLVAEGAVVPEGTSPLRQGIPMFGDLSADGKTLFMPYQRVEAVAIIDVTGARPVIKGTIDLAPEGCLNVHQVTLLPEGDKALAVCEGDHVGPGTLHVLALKTGEVTKTVRVGIYPDSVGILRRRP
ncbi:YncE family protein [Archangium primigenium]|uniref:YncE family protein n=1 Tax=[Archangium] primigenium TaxID=2792470 RepID=UPI001955FB13|nr:hypothetical protein [Archangium primigenium]MBM7112948.1 hypothetical protein [Archangium primigenium]